MGAEDKEMQDSAFPEESKEKAGRKRSEKKAPEGKSLYDIWRGRWTPVRAVNNPATGNRIVLKWRFDREGNKPVKTGIPLEPSHVRTFNTTRQTSDPKAVTEQLFPHGKTDDLFYEIENPFEVKEIE